MGRFERHLDTDLIDLIKTGWKPGADPKPIKRQKSVRPAASYRAARRNAMRRIKVRVL